MAAVAAAMAMAPAVASAAGPDIDAFLVTGTIGAFSTPLPAVGLGTAQYTLSGLCVSVSVAGTSIPTFIDVPPDEGGTQGTCASIGGSGTITSVACGTGTASGSMTITEPSASTASLVYTLVLVGGIGILASSGLGYSDDGGSGPAAGVFVLIPNPTLPEPNTGCTPEITSYSFTGLVVAEY